MLDKQNDLQVRLGYDIPALDMEERTAFIKEFSIHLNQEVNEMLYELPFFKPWKDYNNMSTDEMAEAIVKARKEYVDTLHFMLNIGLALGFDEEQMYDEYMQKNKENHVRQDAGYTHEVQYR